MFRNFFAVVAMHISFNMWSILLIQYEASHGSTEPPLLGMWRVIFFLQMYRFCSFNFFNIIEDWIKTGSRIDRDCTIELNWRILVPQIFTSILSFSFPWICIIYFVICHPCLPMCPYTAGSKHSYKITRMSFGKMESKTILIMPQA